MALTGAIITRVNGPVVEIRTDGGLAMLELVEVGPRRLPGEVIALDGGLATVQVYEYTGGLRPGDDVVATGGPLAVELGPGLLGGVFDGVLRPLRSAGTWIEPGSARRMPTTEDRTWSFSPSARSGEQLSDGASLGTIVESSAIYHYMLVPPGAAGSVDWIAPAGDLDRGQPVASVNGRELGLTQRWPIRRPRPARARLPAAGPLLTGQRVLDLLFPIARGSDRGRSGRIRHRARPWLLQQIAKWCDAAVIVYVGCGERGNELADVLEDFEALEDPRTGQPLLERTVLIANTSNMPVMAREASIYTGVTVAEYYRDMGYDAVVIADSTSRWAEALREFASRTDELPAEEGYPAGLCLGPGRLLRAGRPRADARRPDGLRERPRRRLPSRWRPDRAGDRRTPGVSCARCGRSTATSPMPGTTRRSAGATPHPATSTSWAPGRRRTAIPTGENGEPRAAAAHRRRPARVDRAARRRRLAARPGTHHAPHGAPVARGGAPAERGAGQRPVQLPRQAARAPDAGARRSTRASPPCSNAASRPRSSRRLDLSAVLRARYDTPPDGAAEVEQIGRALLPALDASARARDDARDPANGGPGADRVPGASARCAGR